MIGQCHFIMDALRSWLRTFYLFFIQFVIALFCCNAYYDRKCKYELGEANGRRQFGSRLLQK